MDQTQELTFGERAVGLSYNPSGDMKVDALKKIFAEIIDLCNEARASATSSEAKRFFTVAITESQSAQMWAVKAITWE